MKIVTIQQANRVNCCPCPWPVCAAPRVECESISGQIGIEGFFKPEDTEWIIYKKEKLTHAFSNNFDGGYPRHTQIVNASEWFASEIESQLFGSVGACHVLNSGPVIQTCNSSGSALDSFYNSELIVEVTQERVRTPKASDASPCPGSYTDTLTRTSFVGDPPPPPEVTILTNASFGDFFYYQAGGTVTDTSTTEYFTPTTFEGFVALASAEFSAHADLENAECIDGALCYSSLKSGSAFSEESPPPLGVAASALFVSARYRFGVPAGYSTLEAPRSTWQMTWDLVFASHAWWEWYDSGMSGPAPDDSLAFVSQHDWTWPGSMEEPFSPWYVMPVPESSGKIRRVNVMIVCWRSTRQGYKPTAWGDQVALPTSP